jgi:type II restriction enzyme
MSNKDNLRKQRTGTVINNNSEKREGKVAEAITMVYQSIIHKYNVKLLHESRIYLSGIVQNLRDQFSEMEFHYHFETSSMAPDGGIIYLVDKDEKKYPILITEVKNQGTNDLRAKEGKIKQAKGNAIERLGKNVIGFRAALLKESIFPFICFGDGCDFAPDSSILDRVVTINMFGKLNEIKVHNEGPSGIFNRGSFFFREKNWTPKEMADKMLKIANSSVLYYFSKYGEEAFK